MDDEVPVSDDGMFSDPELWAIFVPSQRRASEMSGLSVGIWAPPIIAAARAHASAKERTGDFAAGADFGSWEPERLLTGLLAHLGIGAPRELIAAVHARADALPPNSQTRLMLETALRILVVQRGN